MKNDHSLFWLIEGILAVAAVLMIVVMFGGRQAKKKVAVIISDSDSGGWESFIYGIKQGAQEQGVDIVITGTETMASSQEEQALIRQEIAKGASALILEPAPGEDTGEMLEEIGQDTPFVLVTGGILTEDPDTALTDRSGENSGVLIAPDNAAMGEALAQMMLEDYAGKLSGKSLGIVGASGTQAAADMREGFLSVMSSTGCSISWDLQVEAGNTGSLQDAIAGEPQVDLVAALGTAALEAAGADAEARRLHGAVLYGIASSERAVYYLDHDDAAGLVVPNSFNMGYQSILEITGKLRRRGYRMESHEITFKVVRKEDIFDWDNEKFLFILQ